MNFAESNAHGSFKTSIFFFFFLKPKVGESIDLSIANVVNIAGLIRGGTHLKKGCGDVRPLRPPFHAVSAVP